MKGLTPCGDRKRTGEKDYKHKGGNGIAKCFLSLDIPKRKILCSGYEQDLFAPFFGGGRICAILRPRGDRILFYALLNGRHELEPPRQLADVRRRWIDVLSR